MPYVEVIKSAHNGESHIPTLALEWSMVNPVGSSENKHWQKKWLQIKQDAVLSPLQRSFIIGSLLGDVYKRQMWGPCVAGSFGGALSS